MPRMRIVLLVLAVALALAPVPMASAQDPIGDAARSQSLDPVYVDPAAERDLTPAEANDLRQKISSSDAGPVYVAVLPERARQAGGGSAQGVAQAIAQKLGRSGTYAVVAGGSFSAGSTEVRGSGAQATAALEAHRSEGTAAVLLDFVDRVARLRAGGSPGSGGGGVGSGLLLPALLAGGGALFLLSRRRRRREADAELAELRENVRDDLVALGACSAASAAACCRG
jgi:hypothetical protein